MVNHSKEFIFSGNSSIHSQTIENRWKIMKEKMPSYSSCDIIDSYLAKHVYWYNFLKDFKEKYSSGAKMSIFINDIVKCFNEKLILIRPSFDGEEIDDKTNSYLDDKENVSLEEVNQTEFLGMYDKNVNDDLFKYILEN
jgi:hypothetical protein